MNFRDTLVTCQECNKQFVLTVEKQREMAERGREIVIPQLCAACGACVAACPYGAREIHPVWRIATVNAALCQNCGACVTACPNKASQAHNWTPKQILRMADVLY